jgi:hypothetical protein
MRYALRRDSSHREIADGLRAVGARVVELFDVDLAVEFRGRAWLIECKNPDVKSKRTGLLRKGDQRSKKQAALKEIFGPQYAYAFDLNEALTIIGAVKSLPESGEWAVQVRA